MQDENKKAEQDKPAKKGFNKIAVIWIIALVLVIAAGAAVWQCYRYKLRVNTEIKTIQLALQDIQSLSGGQNKTISYLQKELQLNKRKVAWVLPEVNYLIKLANINLLYNHNVEIAIKLLHAADKNVAALHNATLVKLRTALAGDIGSLQAVTSPDILGAILRLDTIGKQIAKLPVIPQASPAPKSTAVKKTEPKTGAFWHQAWDATLQQLKQIVVISRHKYAIKPLLSHAEQIYMIHNVQLHLLEAKWALLNRVPTLYRSSLKQASQLIASSFAHNVTGVKNILASLQELEQKNIKPALPVISASLAAINNATQNLYLGKTGS